MKNHLYKFIANLLQTLTIIPYSRRSWNIIQVFSLRIYLLIILLPLYEKGSWSAGAASQADSVQSFQACNRLALTASNVTLVCRNSGPVTWRKWINNKPSYYNYTNGHGNLNYSFSASVTESNLTLYNVSKEDAGCYDCCDENNTCSHALLTILDKPVISSNYTSNNRTEISCTARFTTPSTECSRGVVNVQVLWSDTRKNDDSTNGTSAQTPPEAFIVRNPTQDASSDYTCIARLGKSQSLNNSCATSRPDEFSVIKSTLLDSTSYSPTYQSSSTSISNASNLSTTPTSVEEAARDTPISMIVGLTVGIVGATLVILGIISVVLILRSRRQKKITAKKGSASSSRHLPSEYETQKHRIQTEMPITSQEVQNMSTPSESFNPENNNSEQLLYAEIAKPISTAVNSSKEFTSGTTNEASGSETIYTGVLRS